MQTLKALGILILFSGLISCSLKPRDSFHAAVEKYRGTLVDQVNPAGVGAPFFSVKMLNPTWSEETTPIVKMPPLKLIDQDGQPRDQEFFKNKITFITFIFTSCQGFCPNLVKNLQAVEAKLGDSKDIQYVAITVDTENDKPEQLRAFAKRMRLATGKSWTLLTGDHETVISLAKDTFASQAFQKLKPGPRNFAHSEHFYVIDQKGRLRGILNGTRVDSPEAAAELMAQL